MRTFKLNSTVFLVAFFLAISILFFSCKDSDKKDDQKKEETTTTTDPVVKPANGETNEEEKADLLATASQWPYFKLDRTRIEELIARADLPLKWRQHYKLVLEHSLYGVEDNGKVKVKLIGFALKNSSPHGYLAEPFEIRDSAIWKELPNPVILGNNRVDWYAIGELIFIKTGADRGKLKPDFAYILFEPMANYDATQHPGCTVCAGHLWYKITGYKKDGSKYDGWGGGGSGSTNPSPPAEPGL